MIKHRNDLETGIVPAELFDLIVIFCWQDRTGDIEQRSTGLHKACSFSKGFLLLNDPFLQIAICEPPLRIGPTAPCAGAGAGGINQDLIKAILECRK